MVKRPVRSSLCSFVALALFSSIVGCEQEPSITSYDVPRDAASEPAGETSPSRMIAAIVPRESQAWFIKATGPDDAMQELAEDLQEFVASIELDTDQPDEIQWQTPEGWKEGPPRTMREATLVAPGDAAIEVAISKLGYDGKTDEYLLANINRWLGQLGLEPVEELAAADSVEVIELDGGQAWLLDAVGQLDTSSMRPPMRGRPFEVGANTPPQATALATKPAPAAPTVLKFDAPEQWQELPRGSMGSRSYRVGEGDQAVVVKFSDYPPVGMMADPLMNINRWRGQLGASSLTQEELAEQTDEVAIADAEGVITKIVAPDDSQAMLAAMVEHKDRVWFFQLTGGTEAVEAQRAMFVDWIGSVEMVVPADEGEAEGETE